MGGCWGVTSMLISKKGRKVGKSALKVGALAAVGGLAWKAYQQYSPLPIVMVILVKLNVNAYLPRWIHWIYR